MKHGNQTDAIERAKQLDSYHEEQENTPITSNPSTKVYQLIQQLEALSKFYNYED